MEIQALNQYFYQIKGLTLSGPGFFDQPQPGRGRIMPPYLKFDPLELGS